MCIIVKIQVACNVCSFVFAGNVLELTSFYIRYCNMISLFVFAIDYYYQTYYNEVDLPNKASELSVQEDKDIEASTFSSKDQSHIENDTYAGTDITENLGQEDHFASNSQVIECFTWNCNYSNLFFVVVMEKNRVPSFITAYARVVNML